MSKMFDWETFQGAYQNATDEIRLLVDSGQIADLVNASLPTLDRNSKNLAMKGVTSCVLGVYSINQATAFLKQSGVGVDEQIFNQIIDETKSPAVTPPATNAPVNPVRTMEDDAVTAQDGQTYTSSQDALLKINKDEVPKPNDVPHA